MRVCFIGLGTMGLPMALRLEEKGFEVAGWDLVPEARAHLRQPADSMAAAAAEAEAVITMLPEGEHVAAVHASLLAGGLTGPRLLLDCSTIDVASTRRLAAAAEAAGHSFVDAPVSGGSEGARAGSLSFMVGGQAAGIERAMPLLEAMGGKITAFGDAGAGQAAKACHNMI